MHKLFEFLEDEYYKLMLDMSKEIHSNDEIVSIKNRFISTDKKRFFDICHEHEMDGVTGCFARSIGLTLPEYWESEFDKQSKRQEFLKKTAESICEKLSHICIPMVILKNGGIMCSIISEPVKCPMEDIDSLVKKEDFFRAHEVLINNGFVLKFRSKFEKDDLEEAYRHGSAEYYIDIPDNERMWFELSWRAIDGRWIRPDLEPDTTEFIDRSFVAPGTNVHVLCSEDNLLQVCVHTAKHSYCRAPGLRLHMDVDRIVSHCKIDWNIFLELVKKTHVKKSTYLSLYIPSVLFNTPIPQFVLEELKHKKSKRLLNMLAKSGLPHPKNKKFNKIRFLMFQTALYDSKKDIWRTLYPSKQWMKDKYGCKNSFEVFIAIFKRGLDLMGFRRKK